MLSGRRLRELRKSKGYTQEFLATKLGVSKVTVCGYEKETRTPSLNIFLQLLDIFEVEPNYLLGRDNLVSEENTDYKIKMSKEAPTKKQLYYYNRLCKKYNIEKKDTNTLSKLDLRNEIERIIDEHSGDCCNINK